MGAIPESTIQRFNQVVTEKGDELARAHTIRIVAGTDSTLWANYLKVLNAGPSTAKDVLNTRIDEVIAKDFEAYITKDVNRIHPSVMWKIVDGVWWPSIKEVDVALVDHPTAKELTSMRGIAMKTVMKMMSGGRGKPYSRKLDFAFAPLEYGYFRDLTDAYVDVMKWTKSYTRYEPKLGFENNSSISFGPSDAGDIDQSKTKSFLQQLFTTEQAAKVWWISQYGNNPALGRPILTGANLNSYLGYFNMMIGWNGGDTALAKRGIQAAEKSKFSTFPFDSNKFVFNDTATSADVVSIGCCVAAIQAQYKWLQAQKTNANKDFYQGWFDRFFKNPKSLVNMLIIINERVHNNGANEFQYSPKCAARMKAMAAALATQFKLEIGD
jgi:hypothetical protein|tara:strand:- start:2205 stop:3350 length:1146 start_codon:yes stop_codon:yes gene_type:complete